MLKRFMECENMHNIEELSFMSKLLGAQLVLGTVMTEEQINVVLTAINEHHVDNLRDLSFDCLLFGIQSIVDVRFSLDNLKLLHRVIEDQVLLKLEAIHIRGGSGFFS